MALQTWRVVGLVALGLVVGACGEKPQESKARKSDVSAFQGGGSSSVAPGWKSGDAASWEAQMKSRAQYGQNEYTRSSAP